MHSDDIMQTSTNCPSCSSSHLGQISTLKNPVSTQKGKAATNTQQIISGRHHEEKLTVRNLIMANMTSYITKASIGFSGHMEVIIST